jgi:hypothetical protein
VADRLRAWDFALWQSSDVLGYVIELREFERVDAYASDSGDVAEIEAGVDWLFTHGWN